MQIILRPPFFSVIAIYEGGAGGYESGVHREAKKAGIDILPF
jgi:hypothetical protein